MQYKAIISALLATAAVAAPVERALCTVSGVDLLVGQIVTVSGNQAGTVVDINNNAISLSLCSGGDLSVTCGDILSVTAACPATKRNVFKRAACTVSGVDLSVGQIVTVSGNQAGTVIAINNDAISLSLCSGGDLSVTCGDVLSVTAACPSTKRTVFERAACTVSGADLSVGQIVTVSGNQAGTVVAINNDAVSLSLCSGGDLSVTCGDILSVTAACPATKRTVFERQLCTVSGVELTVGKIVTISGNKAGTVIAISNNAISLDLCSGGSIDVSCGDILDIAVGC